MADTTGPSPIEIPPQQGVDAALKYEHPHYDNVDGNDVLKWTADTPAEPIEVSEITKPVSGEVEKEIDPELMKKGSKIGRFATKIAVKLLRSSDVRSAEMASDYTAARSIGPRKENEARNGRPTKEMVDTAKGEREFVGKIIEAKKINKKFSKIREELDSIAMSSDINRRGVQKGVLDSHLQQDEKLTLELSLLRKGKIKSTHAGENGKEKDFSIRKSSNGAKGFRRSEWSIRRNEDGEIELSASGKPVLRELFHNSSDDSEGEILHEVDPFSSPSTPEESNSKRIYREIEALTAERIGEIEAMLGMKPLPAPERWQDKDGKWDQAKIEKAQVRVQDGDVYNIAGNNRFLFNSPKEAMAKINTIKQHSKRMSETKRLNRWLELHRLIHEQQTGEEAVTNGKKQKKINSKRYMASRLLRIGGQDKAADKISLTPGQEAKEHERRDKQDARRRKKTLKENEKQVKRARRSDSREQRKLTRKLATLSTRNTAKYRARRIKGAAEIGWEKAQSALPTVVEAGTKRVARRRLRKLVELYENEEKRITPDDKSHRRKVKRVGSVLNIEVKAREKKDKHTSNADQVRAEQDKLTSTRREIKTEKRLRGSFRRANRKSARRLAGEIGHLDIDTRIEYEADVRRIEAKLLQEDTRTDPDKLVVSPRRKRDNLVLDIRKSAEKIKAEKERRKRVRRPI